MAGITQEQGDRSAEIHRERLGMGGPSFLQRTDVVYCIPTDLRDRLYASLTGADYNRLMQNIWLMAYQLCQNSFKQGKSAAEAHDAHQLKSLGYEQAKTDMRRWLDGEDA